MNGIAAELKLIKWMNIYLPRNYSNKQNSLKEKLIRGVLYHQTTMFCIRLILYSIEGI